MQSLVHVLPPAGPERDELMVRLLALADRGPAVLYAAKVDGHFTVTYMSPSCLGMVGYSADEFLADPSLWTSNLHPEDQDRVFASVANVMEVGRVVLEYRFRARSGDYRTMRDELIVLKAADGTPVEILGYWIDISDKVAVEKELRELSAELEKRVEERTHTLETLLKEVHHRVKNNLQVVTSLLRLSSGDSADPAVREAFRKTESRVRAMSLVHELLYRGDNLASLDVGDYLREVVAQLVRGLPEADRVDLRVDADKECVALEDATPIGLIATELISNALKHAFPNGRKGAVSVDFRSISAVGDERSCELVVKDDGVGLDASAMPESANAGSGLGLNLVRNLARQLRGFFAFTPRPLPDAGMTARVTLKLRKPGP